MGYYNRPYLSLIYVMLNRPLLLLLTTATLSLSCCVTTTDRGKRPIGGPPLPEPTAREINYSRKAFFTEINPLSVHQINMLPSELTVRELFDNVWGQVPEIAIFNFIFNKDRTVTPDSDVLILVDGSIYAFYVMYKPADASKELTFENMLNGKVLCISANPPNAKIEYYILETNGVKLKFPSNLMENQRLVWPKTHKDTPLKDFIDEKLHPI